MPTLGLGTWFQPPAQVSVTAVPLTGVPAGVIESFPSGGGTNGLGRTGVVVDPVIWNSGVIGTADQLLSRHPSPNACCRLASRWKWS